MDAEKVVHPVCSERQSSSMTAEAINMWDLIYLSMFSKNETTYIMIISDKDLFL